ncbi:hypothetical protein HDE_14563 [Halotydeus destructor]|nr:hypothetical protein HDE_14563 [Halotydeus destructor]
MDLSVVRTLKGFAPLIEFHLSTCFDCFPTVDEFNRKVLAVQGIGDDDTVDEFSEDDDKKMSTLLEVARPQLNVEGVWRKSGNLSRIKQLLLDTEAASSGSFSIHDICHAIKKLFKCSPPLLSLLDLLAVQFFGNTSQVPEKASQALRLYIILRPLAKSFLDLMSCLGETIRLSSENRMESSALATCFMPMFFPGSSLEPERCESQHALLAWLLVNFEDIMKEPIPKHVYPDLVLLEMQHKVSGKRKESPSAARESSDDDEVYTSVRFCAVTDKEEEEDLTKRELARLYAHVQQSSDRKMIGRFAAHNKQQLTPQAKKVKDGKTPKVTPMKRFATSLKKTKKLFMKDAKENDEIPATSAYAKLHMFK